MQFIFEFPAPREVDRELYNMKIFKNEDVYKFPAPREVDRELYVIPMFIIGALTSCFRPLAR